jgi:epidermal growth factor receptor substrate 15
MPSLGRAISTGTEHDDPILKKLTGMGYDRNDALSALEKYDYDISKVSGVTILSDKEAKLTYLTGR